MSPKTEIQSIQISGYSMGGRIARYWGKPVTVRKSVTMSGHLKDGILYVDKIEMAKRPRRHGGSGLDLGPMSAKFDIADGKTILTLSDEKTKDAPKIEGNEFIDCLDIGIRIDMEEET